MCMKKRIIIFGLLLTLLGCKQELSEQLKSTTEVYISTNQLQCENNGLSLLESKNALRTADIQVIDSQCAIISGLMYAAGCGMPTGRIYVHRILLDDQLKAEQSGFTTVEQLAEGYQYVECVP